jgi:hypothetical protein
MGEQKKRTPGEILAESLTKGGMSNKDRNEMEDSMREKAKAVGAKFVLCSSSVNKVEIKALIDECCASCKNLPYIDSCSAISCEGCGVWKVAEKYGLLPKQENK